MIIMDKIEQGTDEWFAEKCGKPSSSNFGKVIGMQGKPSKSAKDYCHRLAGELITGKAEQGYKSAAMEEGNAREEESRQLFSAIHGMEIRQVGLIYKDELRNVLCSPDGIMQEHETGLELKNPQMNTHVSYLLSGKLPSKYFPQVQGSMWVTGYSHWWFMSYYPGLAPFILKVERDNDWIAKLETEMNKFTAELSMMYKQLKAM